MKVDEDLKRMGRSELILTLMSLRSELRKIRDAEGHDLCWYQPDLWALLPEKIIPVEPKVPQDFIQKCKQYHAEITNHIPWYIRFWSWFKEQFTLKP